MVANFFEWKWIVYEDEIIFFLQWNNVYALMTSLAISFHSSSSLSSPMLGEISRRSTPEILKLDHSGTRETYVQKFVKSVSQTLTNDLAFSISLFFIGVHRCVVIFEFRANTRPFFVWPFPVMDRIDYRKWRSLIFFTVFYATIGSDFGNCWNFLFFFSINENDFLKWDLFIKFITS